MVESNCLLTIQGKENLNTELNYCCIADNEHYYSECVDNRDTCSIKYGKHWQGLVNVYE